MSVETKIRSLISASNAKTGGADATLTDALKTLIDGYGSPDHTAEDSLVTGTITEYSNDRVTTIRPYAFYAVKQFTTAKFQNVTSIGTAAFGYCSILTTVDLPNVTRLGSYSFNNCLKLTKLILRKNTVCTLSNTNPLTNTPIASGTGYIYVPSALIDEYKAATNWVTYAAQFRALEDYTVDGTTTGELDESKVSA